MQPLEVSPNLLNIANICLRRIIVDKMVTKSDVNAYDMRRTLNWISPPISKTIQTNNKKELKLMKNIDEDDSLDVPWHEVYQRKNGAWIFLGWCCQECHRVIDDKKVKEKHRYVCRRVNSYKSAGER